MSRRTVRTTPNDPPHRVPASRSPWLRRRNGRPFALALLCALCAALAPGAAVLAEEASRTRMQSLDEQVQEIKSDVLAINAELNALEERLLYPSDTQVAVFVSLAEDESMRLDSVQIDLDGEAVARHIYSFKELEALQKGGVQRIYTGNVATGEHQLDVSVTGRMGGADFSQARSIRFTKEVEPKLLGITLDGQGSGDVSIQLGDW